MEFLIGGAQLGSKYSLNQKKKINSSQIEKILTFSIKNDINKIDYSLEYGNHKKVLSLLDKYNFHLYFKIKSDFFLSDRINIYEFFEELKDNYKNIKFEAISIHNPDFIKSKQINSIQHKCEILKKKKLFNLVGLSLYNPNTLNLYDLDLFNLIQIPLNILDNRFLEKDNGYFLKKMKCVQVRSVFLQGLLLMSSKKQSKFFPNHAHLWFKIDQYCKRMNISKYELCLNFIKQKKLIDQTIIGIDNLTQLKKLINFNNVKKKYKTKYDFKINDENLLLPYKWKIKNEGLAKSS